MPLHSLILIFALICYSSAHGIVTSIVVAGKPFKPWLPYHDIYQKPVPQSFTRRYSSNKPISDVSSTDIRCNVDDFTPTAISNDPAKWQNLTITGGDSVTFQWSPWPENHHGPVMTYLAKCPSDDCTNFSGDGDVWFKIDHSGLLDPSSGLWATDKVHLENQTSFTMPTDLQGGAYILRHELLALHMAQNISGAQFYPSCHQMTLISNGSTVPKGYSIPGIYKAQDPSIKINIWWPKMKSYSIPGPPLYSLDSNSNSTLPIEASTSQPAFSASPTVAAKEPNTTTSNSGSSTNMKHTCKKRNKRSINSYLLKTHATEDSS